jgi:AcrR family transcriptional regulator
MPKVSEEHLEARKQQIVDAAFVCFARKGFHPTTMQDICAAAELSAGAIYRYFGSKEEIIASACDESQNATDVGLLGAALEVTDTREMLRGLTRAFFSRLDGDEAKVTNGALVQLWAEATVNASIRGPYQGRLLGLRAALTRVMFAVYDGYRLQKAIDPGLDTEAYREVIEALLTGCFWTGGQLAAAIDG